MTLWRDRDRDERENIKEMAGEWVSPQEWRSTPSPLGFDRQGNSVVGNGRGVFYEIETGYIIYDFGVVVLTLLGP